jgi:hypothetical protein
MNISVKRRNPVAKDLRSPKYRMRVVNSKKQYNRQTEKSSTKRELYAG